jgi:hypothetical protein
MCFLWGTNSYFKCIFRWIPDFNMTWRSEGSRPWVPWVSEPIIAVLARATNNLAVRQTSTLYGRHILAFIDGRVKIGSQTRWIRCCHRAYGAVEAYINFCNRRKWLIFTPRPFYHRQPLDGRLGGTQVWFIQGGEGKNSAPFGNLIPIIHR